MDETTPREIGPYRLDVLLGRGGMGEVYRAWDARLERWVAVKRLRPDAASETARRRFLREARAAARLGHPAVVQVFDVLQEHGDDWLVMELVDGPDLKTLLHDGPLDVGLAVEYGRQVADGLAAAHAAGIVHRDLKTENVMVVPSGDDARPGRSRPGRMKILDFGLARTERLGNGDGTSPSEIDETLSFAGRIAGTPRAMSPEQALGRDVDFRTDLFALGVLLYELLTARSPFRGRTVRETLSRVVTHQQGDVRGLNPKVPDSLAELVDHLLEKEALHRPKGAAWVADALVDVAAGNPLYRTSGSTLDGTTIAETPPEEAVVKTLLVSDLVGSTRLVTEIGDRASADLFARHGRLARDLLAEHGGTEVDKTDGFLLLFDRPWTAVGYALAYHAALRRLSDERGQALTARVGIHLGEVILRRNSPSDVARGAKPLEVEGLAKPTAARLMSLAEGGQTLLTRGAYDVARRSATGEEAGALRWMEHGPYRFKGVADDVDVFEVGVEGTAPLVAPEGSEKARRADSGSPRPRLAPSSFPRTGVGGEGLGVRGQPQPQPQPRTLRHWPPPPLPEQPYPVLLPYTHPALLAGRDDELEDVRTRLRMPVPILGLGAPSGTGKSSFLLGGLVPALREEQKPVAVVRHPREEGVAGRLLGDLLEGTEEAGRERLADDDWRGFVRGLAEVERLAGAAPLLVLDQFEDVLHGDAAPARARLGLLLAASAQRRPGLNGPLCRWLLAYRMEYHGEVLAWLEDVRQDVSATEALPHDLSGPDRFHSLTLAPLATPSPGGDALAEATRVFQAAIEKPLGEIPGDESPGYVLDGALRAYRLKPGDPSALAEKPVGRLSNVARGFIPGYPLRFSPGHAERLARAFAAARLARPKAPLAPELQVVLAHLLARATPDGLLNVPDDPGDLVEEALTDHLRRALETAFPAGTSAVRTRRARALLALRELATATGQRDEGVRAEDLARAVGEDGDRILQQLATPLTRLVVLQDSPEGLRYVLSHDRMAEVVVRMVEEEGRHGKLTVDAELLALRRFVALKTALHQSRAPSTRIPRRHFRGVAAHAEALLWDDERRAWWAACQRRRRADLTRSTFLTAAVVVFLALVTWGVWSGVEQRSRHQALLDQVVRGEPGVALRVLDQLARDPETSGDELLALLRQREVPMDILELGLGGIPEGDLANVILRTVEIALPWVAENPDDPVLLAKLVWALDYGPGRDSSVSAEARALRDEVLEPLRRLRPPPSISPEDPDWVEIPAGTFQMGSPDGEGNDHERPRHEVTVSAFRILRHEVTNAEYRLLVSDHPGEDHLPADYMSWYESYTYSAWLGGRLPTEAEWEYAARADCPYAYCTEDGQGTSVDDVAWTLRNSQNPETGTLTPQPIKRLAPNPWGLYDMLGNLWEWTADGYAPYPPGAQVDPWVPAAATSGGGRVSRGGSFWNQADWARVADRFMYAPGDEFVSQGFRVVLPGRPEP